MGFIRTPMCGSRKFCQRGSNFDNVFFFFFSLMRGDRTQIPLYAVHHRLAGGPMLAQH